MEINHKEAHLYAVMHQDESNLARCYLELEKRIAELEAAQPALALDAPQAQSQSDNSGAARQ